MANPSCKLTNIANGVLIEVTNSRRELNGVYFYPTIQEALIHLWTEMYPNSASRTLEFIKAQVPAR